MKTLRINDRKFQVKVTDIARRSRWPGGNNLGDIGGYVQIDNEGSVMWVLSRDNQTFLPCPDQEESVQIFLRQWESGMRNNRPTPEEQETWDHEIHHHNQDLLAEAAKTHTVKQEVIYRLHDASRFIVDSYQSKEGETLPESLNRLYYQLRTIERTLQNEKELIPLLGQEVEALKVNLPEWAELKNP